MVVLLPATYVGFLILHNMRSYMKDAMPTGLRRLLWNVGLVLAIAIVTAASAIKVYNKWQASAAAKKDAEPKKAAEVEPARRSFSVFV
jgi:hypothetical protein